MRESIVVICPTRQAKVPATDWHDGQLVHGGRARTARRAVRRACKAKRAHHSRAEQFRDIICCANQRLAEDFAARSSRTLMSWWCARFALHTLRIPTPVCRADQ
jgi:hypothetical protein